MTKEDLIKELIQSGHLKTPEIIRAFEEVDRAKFVLPEYENEAYENHPLSIGFEQTISQPLTVAFMLESLQPRAGERILEIGAGSGWQTAILAFIAGSQGRIVAIERIPELVEMTGKNISQYNFLEKNIVNVLLGDGSQGYPAEAHYDKIIAAAAGQEIPEEWKEQLKVGGRIVAPVENSIIVIDKIADGKFQTKEHFGFRFVPLIKDRD